MSEGEGEEPTALVFFCSKCRTILGDSLSLLFADQTTNTVTLEGVVRTTKSKGLRHDDSDSSTAGCSYRDVACSGCQTVVGRSYTTTTPALDRFRGHVSLDLNQVESYSLGCASEDGRDGGPGVVDHVERLATELNKVQAMVLCFNERLENLEAASQGKRAPVARGQNGNTKRVRRK
mmetsp:Transcript_24/g.37  ORF Transcript_24/g.37 Transcript_24/m.37 type:complete len:177 (-) Transcript_24:46-576(-)